MDGPLKGTLFAIAFLSIFPMLSENVSGLSFWKTCLKIDESFYYQIIDPDIIEIGNSDYFAYAFVRCEGVPRRNAFSMCANGCPIFPNSWVRIARNKIKICEGDIIFVGNDECELEDIDRHSW